MFNQTCSENLKVWFEGRKKSALCPWCADRNTFPSMLGFFFSLSPFRVFFPCFSLCHTSPALFIYLAGYFSFSDLDKIWPNVWGQNAFWSSQPNMVGQWQLSASEVKLIFLWKSSSKGQSVSKHQFFMLKNSFLLFYFFHDFAGSQNLIFVKVANMKTDRYNGAQFQPSTTQKNHLASREARLFSSIFLKIANAVIIA